MNQRIQAALTTSETKANEAAVDFPITTIEQQRSQETGRLDLYFQRDVPVCQSLLRCGTRADDLEAVRRLFPFVREGMMLGIKGPGVALSSWLESAFLTGHQFAIAHAELAAGIVPASARPDTEEGLNLLLQTNEQYAGASLVDLFTRLTATNKNDDPDEQARVILRAWRSGVLATALSVKRPAVRDLLSAHLLNHDRRLKNWSLAPWLMAASLAVGRSPLHQMQHVLMKLAPWFYGRRKTEGEIIGGFIAARLGNNLVHEWECEDNAATLLDWLDAGVEFGQQVLRQSPGVVSKVSRELGPQQSELIDLTCRAVREARGVNAARLLGPVLRYVDREWDDARPNGRAESYRLVMHVLDFGVWAPWAEALRKHQVVG